MRIGFGYDIHPLVEGRKLILGGVEIFFEKGLQGHSDADVLLHAICDGILGALGEGDIGMHFPDSDPRFKGVSSVELLRAVAAKMVEKNWVVENLDSTVVAERPRIRPFIPRMKEQIAGALRVSAQRIHIKATTSEGLGFLGEGKGMAAYAVVLLKKARSRGGFETRPYRVQK